MGENIYDLFQIGCVGLIKVIDKFDITRKSVKLLIQVFTYHLNQLHLVKKLVLAQCLIQLLEQ